MVVLEKICCFTIVIGCAHVSFCFIFRIQKWRAKRTNYLRVPITIAYHRAKLHNLAWLFLYPFLIWFSNHLLYRFWSHLGLRNPSKIDKKINKKSIQNFIHLLIDVSSILAPFWYQKWIKNRSNIDQQFNLQPKRTKYQNQ